MTLNSIRSGIKKDKNYILPEESEYFSDIAPRRYDIRTLEMMVENTKTKEDFERVLAKIAEDYTVGFI